jgi:rfaE bifunctional protein nucleotidyltransferase chain/domain
VYTHRLAVFTTSTTLPSNWHNEVGLSTRLGKVWFSSGGQAAKPGADSNAHSRMAGEKRIRSHLNMVGDSEPSENISYPCIVEKSGNFEKNFRSRRPAVLSKSVLMDAAFERKICPPQQLAARLAGCARPLVFTNGVFDVLHRGHVTYLAQARGYGATLLVALNGDASVKRLGKGEARPLNALPDRMAVVAALESVGLVTWFDEDTPLALILTCRPEVLVKGGDWKANAIVGATEVRSWGGSVHSIPFKYQRSTTALFDRIRGS